MTSFRFLPLVLTSVVISAYTVVQAGAQTTRQALREIVHLEERFDQGARRDGVPSLPLAFGVSFHDVGINSSIKISVDASGWAKALRADPRLAALVSPEVATILTLSGELEKASDDMIEAVRAGAEMARLAAQNGRATPAFALLAQAQQEKFRNAFTVLNAYQKHLAASPSPEDVRHGVDVRRRFNDAANTNPKGSGRLVLSALLLQEVDWITARIEQMRAEIAGGTRSLAIVLSAVHYRGGVPIEEALPGFNDIPEGIPIPYEQLNLVPSAEEVAEMEKLREEAARWAVVLNRVRTERVPLEDAVNDLLRDTALDLEGIQSAVTDAREAFDEFDATDWRQVGDRLQQQLENALSEAADDAERAAFASAGPLGSAIATFSAGSRQFASDLAAFHAELATLERALAETADRPNEVGTLVSFLSLMQHGLDLAARGRSLLSGLSDEIEAWSRNGTQLNETAKELETLIADLRDDIQSKFEPVFEEAARTHLGELVAALEHLAREVGDFVSAIDVMLESEDAGLLLLAAATDIEPPPSSFDVPLDTAPDTHLDLQTLNPRRENDVVELRAWLYRLEANDGAATATRQGGPISTVFQRMRMIRFGWYNAPSVGLTYLSSANVIEGMDTESRSFEPQVSWMFLRRSWRQLDSPSDPSRYVSKFTDNFSVGMHTVTLDLDKDNQLEVGFGVSLGIYKDWFQLGAGIDVSLDDEPYYFIGTRLFQVLKGIGIKTQEADAK